MLGLGLWLFVPGPDEPALDPDHAVMIEDHESPAARDVIRIIGVSFGFQPLNPEIEGRFRRIDSNCFTAVAYRDGEALARCAIRLADGRGSGGGITYSHNDSAANGSYNESLSVGSDSQHLYLKPLGMSMLRSGERDDSNLSMEGGAELYWELFIEPLQRD